jgi:transposase
MDKLHPKIDSIKTLVFKRTQSLFPQGIHLLLFDVTTLYFESIDTDDLREFGYSKDHRFNTTQVVLALATNTDGLPLGYELFKGNTAEVTTLCSAIERWKENLPIENVCFVGDRAMFCEKNLALLEKKGYQYVVAAKLRGMPKVLQSQILSEENYHINVMGSDIGWFAEFEHNNRRLITSYKTKRALNDAQKRNKIIDKITKTLEKSKKTGRLINNNGVKKYTKTLGKSETVLDPDKIQLDADWDGIHGVITNIKDASALEILSHYSRLWVIEESFRINKHNLKMRPIYHFKKERIEAHIAICYMCFSVLRHLQYEVRLTQKVSPDEIMHELLNVQSSIYIHKETKDRYRVPGKTSHKASKIYKALGLTRTKSPSVYL